MQDIPVGHCQTYSPFELDINPIPKLGFAIISETKLVMAYMRVNKYGVN